MTGAAIGTDGESLELSWGKRLGSTPYALAGHLIDTGLVLQLLWESVFEPSTKSVFKIHFGSEALDTLTLAGATHDCGKLTPLFQCRLLDSKRPSWAPEPPEGTMPAGFGDIVGLRQTHRQTSYFLGHATESGRTLKRAQFDSWFQRVVEGHHGRFPDFLDEPGRVLAKFQKGLEDSNWVQRQRRVLLDVLEQLDIDPEVGKCEPATRSDDADTSNPLAVLAAGWVSVADWIASSEVSVEHGCKHQDLLGSAGQDSAEFCTIRKAFLADQVQATVGLYQHPKGDFRELFGFEPSRPVQRFVVEGGIPEFQMLCVPMGSGKTEAALERHRKLKASSLYFALPTMATADAMFERVRRFFGSTKAQSGALLHGRSSVNDFYAGVTDSDFEHTSFESDGLTATEWLRGKHRGLLAPVGVGTVDQALAGILRRKYNTVRLAAMANTHIIFDEAHSYDPYQQTLFGVLLRWLGMHRAPVTVLSATMPSELAASYASAYRSGWSPGTAGVPDGWSVEYPGAVEVAGGGEPRVQQIEAGDQRTLSLTYHEFSDNLADSIVVKVRELRYRFPQAALGVVVNTVATCLEVGRLLEDLNPLVLHARMPSRLRAARQDEVTCSVGPNSPSKGQLVIGTQVLEQSLDLDFDFLVTAFAPAPDLVQRTGRLWRHSTCTGEGWRHPDSRRWRHELQAPEVHIFAPSVFDQSTCLPYMAGVVKKAWVSGFDSGQRAVLRVPDDLQHVVDNAHIRFVADDLDDPTMADLLGRVRTMRKAAKDRSIPIDDLIDYPGEGALPQTTSGMSGSVDEWATRWQEEVSETFVLLSDSNPWALRESEVFDRSGSRRKIDFKAVIGASVSLSGRTCRWAQKHSEDFASRVKSSSKRLGLCIDLDRTSTISLDEKLGLVIGGNKEGGGVDS